MLRLPREGFRLSVNAHNVSLDALVEWVEGSITFADDKLTQTDAIDILMEEEIYRSQDFARERLEIAWGEMARRQKVLGSYSPYSVDGHASAEFLIGRKRPRTPSACCLRSKSATAMHSTQRFPPITPHKASSLSD